MKFLYFYMGLTFFVVTIAMFQCELTNTCLLVDYKLGSWSILKK